MLTTVCWCECYDGVVELVMLWVVERTRLSDGLGASESSLCCWGQFCLAVLSAISSWLWAKCGDEWMIWYICALVQQFLCPLSSRLCFQGGSGLQEVKGIDHSLHGLKCYSSEQWRSAAMIHEESSSILDMWTRWRLRVLCLPFQDAIPRASPYDFSDNPAFSFDFYIRLPFDQVSECLQC